MHKKEIIKSGKDLHIAKKAVIMIHGRGGSAEDILTLSSHLHIDDYALFAPQATNNTWYPLSFLAPPQQNEPWLSSALELVGGVVADITNNGVPVGNIFFVGFSQGACLTLEYVTRNAQKYGGVVAFTGGLIGDRIYSENYQGDFGGTPVFIGSSDPDPHVPVKRVYDTVNMMKSMHAAVTEKIYTGMGHTIHHDEIEMANQLVFLKTR